MDRQDIPRVLVERNPRNSAHVRAAYDLIASIAGAYATEQTFREVRSLGLKVKNLKKLRRRPGKDEVMVAAFFFLEQGLLISDNILCTCKSCGAALQIRPHSNVGCTVLCCFCTADQALKDYWEKQNEQRTNSRTKAG